MIEHIIVGVGWLVFLGFLFYFFIDIGFPETQGTTKKQRAIAIIFGVGSIIVALLLF